VGGRRTRKEKGELSREKRPRPEERENQRGKVFKSTPEERKQGDMLKRRKSRFSWGTTSTSRKPVGGEKR